jgi:hypothetical protein
MALLSFNVLLYARAEIEGGGTYICGRRDNQYPRTLAISSSTAGT